MQAATATYNALIETMHYGDEASEGHSLGSVVVSLQQLATSTVDMKLAQLIPAEANDIAAIRTSMLNGADPSAIGTQQLDSDSNQISDYCGVQSDPLSS